MTDYNHSCQTPLRMSWHNRQKKTFCHAWFSTKCRSN